MRKSIISGLIISAGLCFCSLNVMAQSSAQFSVGPTVGSQGLAGTGVGTPFVIATSLGNIQIGSTNTNWCQFNASNQRFYLNKDLFVQTGEFIAYGGNNFTISTSAASPNITNKYPRITVLASNGNVGIGTLTPITPLQLSGDMTIGSTVVGNRWQFHTQSWMPQGDLLISPDDNTGNFNFEKGIHVQRDGSTIIHTGHQVTRISLGSTGSGPALNYGNGYIGLNMTRNATNSNWTLKTNSAGNGGSVIWNNLFGELFIANVPNGAVNPANGDQYPTDVQVASYTSMKIKWNPTLNNAQVQIGKQTLTTGPHTDYRLSVDGKLLAKEIYVTNTGWADYVFDDNYQLMSIDSLENYVAINNHLPNVPTTEEILMNGNNTGETDRILLEKIEELALYIIEQNKRIQILEEKLNNR